MKFVHRCPAVLFLFLVPCRVLAFPLSYASTVTTRTYVPLMVISISLIFLLVFLAIKRVYMKYRRIGTIHTPLDLSSSTSSVGFRDKHPHRGLLVGCLGSPAWETNLTSKLSGATWRREQRQRSSFGYQRHTGWTTRSAHSAPACSRSRNYSSSSRFTKSTVLTSCSRDVDQHILPWSSGPSRIPVSNGGGSLKSLYSVQRDLSTNRCPRYDDFGKSHGMRPPGISNVARRASPSSIRLVDGPSHSSQVEYSFLSGLPPNTVALSPLMGTRDSFQLSRCSLKCNRKPVPPMPPLPLFLPFCLPNGPESMESQPLQASEYLPPLRFSPLVGTAKVFHSQEQVFEKKAPVNRVSDPDESKNDDYSGVRGSEPTSSVLSKTQHARNTSSLTGPSVHARETNVMSNHKRSQSCKGLAVGGTSPQTMLVTGEIAAALSSRPLEDKRCSEIESMRTGILRTPSDSSRNGSVVSKKPLKSCLRQNTIVPMPPVCSSDFTLTPSLSDTSTQMYMPGTRRSLWTSISDVDVEILGLDRFSWNDEYRELKVQSSHTKKDSVALVQHWD